jgi:heat shock protein 1/8
MSVIGLDFGSHTASIAIWYEEKNSIEVLADDLGSRTIPCTVAFRGDEIITGQSAISQQHKNPNNTFDDVRSLLLNSDVSQVSVPLLEKDIQVQELVSHFFRNIHNQIKQQAGKAVRDCIISTPSELDEATKKRFTESAQAGGIRIKNFISDSAATLMAYELDDVTRAPSKTLVVDIGWSRTDISLYDVSAGMFNLLSSSSSSEVSGKVFVKLAADHCAKDFQRKTKVPCTEYSKSMLRLHRECEHAMKSLSTGAEATIDIDSLCEGMDYSAKLTRARFEDLLTIPFIHLKSCINNVLASAGTDAANVTQVCMSGGASAMPKVVSIIKGLFTTASFPKVKFESCETQCIGAATHGKNLLQQVAIRI